MYLRHISMAFGLIVHTSTIGCGSGKLPPVDPAQAKQALGQALDAWKSGAAPESLADLNPPISIQDWDWANGVKLADYEILGNGKGSIGYWRCGVKLKLHNGNKGILETRSDFAVKTTPEIKIMRAAFSN